MKDPLTSLNNLNCTVCVSSLVLSTLTLSHDFLSAKSDSVLLHIETLLTLSLTISGYNIHQVKKKLEISPPPWTDVQVFYKFLSLTHTHTHTHTHTRQTYLWRLHATCPHVSSAPKKISIVIYKIFFCPGVKIKKGVAGKREKRGCEGGRSERGEGSLILIHLSFSSIIHQPLLIPRSACWWRIK